MSSISRSRMVFVGIVAGAIVLVAIGVILSGNTTSPPTPTGQPGAIATPVPAAGTVTIVVQSANTKELWMDTMQEKFNAQGATLPSGEQVVVEVHHTGSGLKTELESDMWSPANQVWVDLTNQDWRDRNNRALVTDTCPSTVSIPIGFAMWQPMAEALGWPDEPIGWADITDLALNPDGWAALGHPEWGTFKFGHGHPEHSNSGRLSIVAEIYAATGKTEGLTYEDVWSDEATSAVGAVQTAVQHYGEIDTALLNKMVERGPDYLHAVTNYEGNVIRWNEEYGEDGTGELRFPLVLVYPSDGTFWMDHPLCILNNAEWMNEKQIEAAQLFQAFVLEEEQQALLPETGIRPAVTDVPMDGPGSKLTQANGVVPSITQDTVPVLAYPPQDIIRNVIDMWYTVKKPATVVMVIDISGSMNDDNKIKGAVAGARSFISKMQPKDEIFVLAFNDDITRLEPSGVVGQVREELLKKVDGLFASGGTALYRVTIQGIEMLEEMRQEDLAGGEKRIYGIVLMSDGANSTDDGLTESHLLNVLPKGETSDEIRIYTIAYGDDAERNMLRKIANRTNGKYYEGSVEEIENIYFLISSEF